MTNDYTPKFGDLVRVTHPKQRCGKRKYMICIWPKGEHDIHRYKESFFNIANLDYNGELSYHCGNGHDYESELIVEKATSDDEYEFQLKLTEVGQVWDPIKKTLIYRFKKGDILVIDDQYLFVYLSDCKNHTACQYLVCMDLESTTMTFSQSPTPNEIKKYSSIRKATFNEVELFEFQLKLQYSLIYSSTSCSFYPWTPKMNQLFYYINTYGKIRYAHYTPKYERLINIQNCFASQKAATRSLSTLLFLYSHRTLTL